MGEIEKRTVVEIPVKDLYPDPNQPRKNFDVTSLRDLGRSLRHDGQKLEIMVRPITSKGKTTGFTIIYGGRRYAAAKLEGLETLRAFVVDTSDPKEIRRLQVIENERKNLDPMEKIAEYAEDMKVGFTLEETATMHHVSTVTVQKDVLLLELPEIVRKSVDKGDLPKSVVHFIREQPKGRWMKAFKWAMRNPGNASRMVASIQNEVEKIDQRSLWGGLPKSGTDVIAYVDGKAVTLKDGAGAQKRLMREIQRFVEIYDENAKMVIATPPGVSNIAHLRQAEEMGRMMTRTGKFVTDMVEKYKADPNNVAKLKAEEEKEKTAAAANG